MLPDKDSVLLAMRRVNDRWIADHPSPGDNGWARATYFEGDMAMYAVYPSSSYLRYATGWADDNAWDLKGGALTRNADNQCAGQVYFDLYRIEPDSKRIAAIESSLAAMVAGEKIDDWSWADALQMAMPAFARMAVVSGDMEYSARLYEMYRWTRISQGGGGLYSATDHLWWRDASYRPPTEAPNGKSVYWARGNGWVLAADARTIDELDRLPAADPNRPEYVRLLREMASAMAAIQQPDGFWSANLLDPADPAGPETSGTALITYGLAWGVNHGVLDPGTYLPVIARAWKGMVAIAVAPDGKLGYIQPVGTGPARSATTSDSYDFGIGAFLLAGSEVVGLAPGSMPAVSLSP